MIERLYLATELPDHWVAWCADRRAYLVPRKRGGWQQRSPYRGTCKLIQVFGKTFHEALQSLMSEPVKADGDDFSDLLPVEPLAGLLEPPESQPE